MKKRLIVFVFTLLLVVGVSIPVLAAGSAQATVSASKGTAYRGDTIDFSVSISSVANCKSAGIIVSYDTSLFEMVGGECLVDASMSDFSGGTGSMAFSTAKTLSGNVFKFTLKVKSGARFGAVASVSGAVSIRDSSGAVSVSVSPASVTVACKHSFNSWSKVDGATHTRKCSTCGAVETKAHVFDHGCDKSCNDCGATRTTAHSYKTEWSSTGEYHFHECRICGDWKDDENHTPGDPATEQAPQICTICQRVLVEKLEHVHELDSNIQSDETGHWYNCAKCDEKAEFAEHIYLFDCDALCDACGYTRPTQVPHTPSEQWAADENGHWHPCSVCQEKVEETAHTGDVNVLEPKCDICQHAMAHEHRYEEKWVSNTEEHWHECVCGEKADTQSHTWDDGVVTEEPYRDKQGVMTYTCTLCGETDTAIIIETSRDLLPWWIACGALGVMVLGMTATLIVILVKANKKATGKYAVK